MKISIVIPNYNGIQLLKKNLPQVVDAQKNQKNEIIEIIIVDDGSEDDSVSYIKTNWPKVKLIKHTINRGFSAAVNTGVRGARGELLCLLNSDVSPKRNFLENISKHFKDEKVFAVSLHELGFGWAKGYFKFGFIGHQPGGEDNNAHISFWASGGSAVFEKSLWTRLGGFDEKLFSPFYWEDLDLCYRAQKRGYQVLWDPGAVVTHEHESTVSKLNKGYINRIRERNQLIFIWKNITSPTLTRRHISGLLKRIVRSPGYLIIVMMALVKLGQIRRARSKERKEAKVSDEAVLGRFR